MDGSSSSNQIASLQYLPDKRVNTITEIDAVPLSGLAKTVRPANIEAYGEI
ncbi:MULTISPECIES: hypothetical protein [unclassified Archaeoglobus]|jgi:hypothetical protein|uniref:hypothetical protein n=1 Tax=unclassified Archaeoglobus TaxID=2643606 RepID=UPI0025C59877|nr:MULTISPECIES: hypothetical protein [unclassified Archaeoglobus]